MTRHRFLAAAAALSLLMLPGCVAAPYAVGAMGFGTAGYAALPGDLEAVYSAEQPANAERVSTMQSVVTSDPFVYEELNKEKLFKVIKLTDRAVSQPRTDQEAASIAKQYKVDAFVRADFVPAAALRGTGFMALKEVLGEYTVRIVTPSGEVVYDQTVTLKKKLSTLNSEHVSRRQVQEHLVGAMVHDLKTKGLQVAQK